MKAKRKELGFNQEDFATFLGVSRSVINNIERGHQKPTLDLAINMAEKLYCSLDVLLFDQKQSESMKALFASDSVGWSSEDRNQIQNHIRQLEGQLSAQTTELKKVRSDYQKALAELKAIKKKLSKII